MRDLEFARRFVLGAIESEAEPSCEADGGRLPTRIELLSIVDYENKGTKKLYSDFMGPTGLYWTSTVSPAQEPWVVDFETGNAGPVSAATPASVRCVYP